MYKITQSGIQRLSDMACIPEAEGNIDWQEYQKWLADGGVPDPEFTQAELDQQAAAEAERLQRIQDMIDNLPSWAAVETNITNITDLAGAKAFLIKLARVVYWLAKSTKD